MDIIKMAITEEAIPWMATTGKAMPGMATTGRAIIEMGLPKMVFQLMENTVI
jgi:hypothetical protein